MILEKYYRHELEKMSAHHYTLNRKEAMSPSLII